MMAIYSTSRGDRGSDGMIMQQDIFIDEDGNTHTVYSQMVKYYAEVGNLEFPNGRLKSL